MNTLLPKLGELLVGEYKLQKGVKGEIEELEKELKGMTAALHKVAETPVDQLDQQVKIWASEVRELSYDIEDAIDTFMLNEVRELSYDIEDAIDTFMLKCKGHEPATSFKKVTNLFNKFKTNHQIHGVMKDIMDQVKKVSERRDRYIVDDNAARPTVVDVDSRLEAMYRKATELIGISKPKNELTKQLLEYDGSSSQQSNIISIAHDDSYRDAWDTIKLAVQDAKLGSKIIVTTRNKVVAEHAGSGVYEMKPLSDDDSRQLFCKRIFDSNDDCPADLCGVTEKILKKCGGVPLAIITTACLLASKPRNSEEWDKVNKSISLGLENNLDVDKMRKILSLSYNDLPFHLKTCLLSLSKYPEDELIRKDVLIWGWLAEGFITDETRPVGTSLQEIGESYFNELINRSLIQPMSEDNFWDEDGKVHVFWDEDGKVHACKVHDMVLELINQLSVEEDFVTTYLSDGQQTGKHTCTAQKKKIRRLSLHNSNKSYASPEAREQLSKVRSITIFGKVDSIPPLSSFHVLRVLQLEDCSGMDKNHLNHLDKLRLLRFLRLGHYSATELPESIGKLESLETLDIRGARKPSSFKSHKVLFPMSFAKLRKLLRLYAGRVKLAQGLMLGNMKSLQELVIEATRKVIKEIGNLTELRTLRIVFGSEKTFELKESIQTSIQRLTNLQDLDLRNNISFEEIIDMQQVPSGLQRLFMPDSFMKAFPCWINSLMLSHLTTLSICLDFEYLQSDHLDRLAELPSLRFLRLQLRRGGLNDLGLENLYSLRHATIYSFDDDSKAVIEEALKDYPNQAALKIQSMMMN
uniref:NB-ARC domain-containing protein n=1 Tax=Oryza rufipogon TaxID=4529 RepID=A0A0E0RHY5_ORYRU